MCRTGAAHWNIPKVEKERFGPVRLPCLSAKSHKLARYQPWKQCINGPEDAEAMKHSEPHADFSIFVVIQLFRSVSSCPYRKDGLFVYTNLQQSEGLELTTMAKGDLHSNSWKAVLVLYHLNTYDKVFFGYEGNWGKNSHLTIITKLSCGWKLVCAIAWETMILIILVLYYYHKITR